MRGPYTLNIREAAVDQIPAELLAEPSHYEREYNARMLFASAKATAARVSRELETEVEVWGNEGSAPDKRRVCAAVFVEGRR